MIRRVAISLVGFVLVVLVTACNSGTAQEDGGRTSSASRDSGSSAGGGRLTNVGRPAEVVFGSSYVSPLTEDFGDVFVGEENFIASSTVLRAAPGLKVELGDYSNVQDNVVVRARERSVTIGGRSSLGHHATVRDSEIGNSTFIGYGAEVSNSEVGDGTVIYHGALVEGVKILEDRYVGAGEEVTDQATADALPEIEEVDVDDYYTQDIMDVGRELTKAYVELYERDGYEAVIDVGANPKTSFNPDQVVPQIGEQVELQEFARVVGDVHVGANSSIGRRTAIRADEGSPIMIGPGAIIDDRVTFHAIRGTEVQIGEYLVAGDDAVLHGPLEMGDENVVGEHAIVFRARVADNVQIGEGAVVAGPAGKDLLEVPDGTIIPGGAVVTSEKDLERLGN